MQARVPTAPAPAAGAVGAARRACGRPASPSSGEARPRDLSAASLHPGEHTPPPPPSPLVLIGHAASLTPY